MDQLHRLRLAVLHRGRRHHRLLRRARALVARTRTAATSPGPARSPRPAWQGLSPATGALTFNPTRGPRAGRRRHAGHQRGPVDRQRQLRRHQPVRRGPRAGRASASCRTARPFEAGELCAEALASRAGTSTSRGAHGLYLGGLGRSGSTLLERLPRAAARGLRGGRACPPVAARVTDGERCGCGQPFRQCPFWQQVGKAAFGGWDRDRHRPASPPSAPGWTGTGSSRGWPPGRLRRGCGPALDEYTSYYPRAYAAIAEVSGSPSWWSTRASTRRWRSACAGRTGVDLRVLHLVRDSRAVAYSWGRAVRPAGHRPGELHDPVLPGVAAAQWNGQNAAFHLLRGMPVMRLRYEDVVAAPAGGPAPDRGVLRAAGAAQLHVSRGRLGGA